MTHQQYILGFGISGAIASVVFPEAKIIAPEPRVMVRMLGPHYLYYDKKLSHVLEELGLQISVKTIKPGFEVDGVVARPDVMVGRNYHVKTRGVMPSREWEEFHSAEEHRVFETSFDNVIDAAYEKAKSRFIYSTVTGIKMIDQRLSLADGTSVWYDSLISTIPAPALVSMAWREMSFREVEFSSAPIWFDVMSTRKAKEKFGRVYDLCQAYCLDYCYLSSYGSCNRITLTNEDLVELEYSAPLKGGALQYFKRGKILGGEMVNIDDWGVYPVGRYAQWKKLFKTDDLFTRFDEIKKVML